MEFGVWSLVPPVLTIALALTTKNVFISLLIGILTGNLVLNHFAVFTGLNAGIYSILDTMTESIFGIQQYQYQNNLPMDTEYRQMLKVLTKAIAMMATAAIKQRSLPLKPVQKQKQKYRK